MRGDGTPRGTTTGRADAGPRARVAAAASAALESGRSVLIGGGPGSGKSRLARRLLDRLDTATPVLVVRATAEQREREFSALTSAWQLAGGHVTTGRGLVESLVRHWSTTSPLQPVVLVEDAQLLDAPSAQALLAAAASGALRLVLTVVDDGEPPQGATAAVERAWVEGWLDRWDLAPLELREVREALSRDGAAATLAQAATALDATGGVPLLLRELRAQPDAGDGHPGPRMRAALHRVIATLRAGERGLIRSLDGHSAVPEREAAARIGAHRVDLLVEHGLLLRLDDGKLRAASSLVTQRLRVLAHAAGEAEQPVAIAAAGADARLAVALRRAVEGRAADALALLPRHGVEAHDPAVVTGTLLVRALVGERTERLPEHLESGGGGPPRPGAPPRPPRRARGGGAGRRAPRARAPR
ncbi:MAG: AAA family ATPase [Microbacteriaceae bacterium]